MLQLTWEAAELHCRVRSIDRLACEVESIHVRSPKCKSRDTNALATMAQQLADRLSYLEERLVLIEVDETEAQVRSESPHVTSGNERSYYELVISTEGIALHRYLKEPHSVRRLIPAVLTRVVLMRLIGDLLASA